MSDHPSPYPNAAELYVSADLQILPMQPDDRWAPDLTQVDDDGHRRTYRRLDIDWLAWLHDRMTEWRAAFDAGDIDYLTWERKRHAYHQIYLWSQHRWGPVETHKTRLAGRILPPTYRPPRAA